MQNSFNSPDIDSYLATSIEFKELKEVIKISIICTEYGSKIVIVPLLVKAVMRNTQILCRNFTFFRQILSKEDSWSRKSTSEEQDTWTRKPSIFPWDSCVLFLCSTLFETLVRESAVAFWRKTLQNTSQWEYFFSRGRGSHVLVAYVRVKTLANEDKI